MTVFPTDLMLYVGRLLPWVFVGAAVGLMMVTVIIYLHRVITAQVVYVREGAARRSDRCKRWKIGEQALAEIAAEIVKIECDPLSVYFTCPLLQSMPMSRLPMSSTVPTTRL